MHFKRPALVVVLVWSVGSGCTTVHAVGPGAQPTEFYVAAQRSYGLFTSHPTVYRCEAPAGGAAACVPILEAEDLLTPVPKSQVAPRNAHNMCGTDGYIHGLQGFPNEGMTRADGEPRDLRSACLEGYASGYLLGAARGGAQ